MNAETERKIIETNQRYLKQLLGRQIPQRLEEQLADVDWSVLEQIHQKQRARGQFAPLGAMERGEIARRRAELEQTGLDALSAGKVGAILLAGGQGTRLGFDRAKGMYDIGVHRRLYIFEQLMENLKKVTSQAGAWIPLYIMTSEKNDADTRTFFEQNGFFGYEPGAIKFFVQGMAPAADFEGNLLLEAGDSLAMSPNGNGGWFKSLLAAGLGEDLQARGIEWLNVFAVDNVLQRIADPVFVGATIRSGCACGAKVVRKCDPYERVGALCLEDGRPSIIEYYELTPEMAEAVDEKGTLLYGFGVILNYLFRLDQLMEISRRPLPVHIVERKVPYLDESGRLVRPEEPNACKFETLILDMVYMMDSCLSFEVEREKEFAPVKNATGADSVESARELLRKNGIVI